MAYTKMFPPPQHPPRSSLVGVEVVRSRGKLHVNVHINGLMSVSLEPEQETMTVPEAMVYVAALIRMGDIVV